MPDLKISELHEMQKNMQEKYLEKWGGLSPEKAIEKLLWLHGELGEASDVIKKNGNNRILNDAAVRAHFIEEMCDVMMYFNDVLICFNITPEEFSKAYTEKYNRNMKRW